MRKRVAKSEAILALLDTFQGAVYKSGTGTRGRGHRGAYVGTWGRETGDLRTDADVDAGCE